MSAPRLLSAQRLIPLHTRLKAGTFARGIAGITFGTALGQLLLVAATPVITRLYPPADFGLFGVYTGVVSLAVVLGAARYELAVPMASDEREALYLVCLSFVVLVGTVVAVAIAVAFFGRDVAQVLRAPEFEPFLWIVPVGLFVGVVQQTLNSYAARLRDYRAISQTKVAQGVGQALIPIIMAPAGPIGLLAGDVAGKLGGTARLGALLLKSTRDIAGLPSVKELCRIARQYKAFPLLSSPSALLNTFALQIPTLLFASLYGPSVAGWLMLSNRVVGTPMRLIGQSVAQVYLGEAARAKRESPERLHPVFKKLASRLLLFGGIPICLIGVGAPFVFDLVFGAEWQNAGVYTALMCPAMLGQFVVSPLSQTAAIVGRQGRQLLLDATRTALLVLSVWIPFRSGWTPNTAVACYAAVLSATYVALYFFYSSIVAAASASTAPTLCSRDA